MISFIVGVLVSGVVMEIITNVTALSELDDASTLHSDSDGGYRWWTRFDDL